MPVTRPRITPMPAPGQYCFTTSPGSASTNGAVGTGSLKLLPWLVTRPFSIDRIGGEITTVGDVGSLLRLGIYADNGNAYPGVLLLDAGTIAGDSATVQQITCALALAPGLYWIGGAVQSVTTTQPTIRVNGTWTPPVTLAVSTTLPATNATSLGYSMSGVTGALPASFSATVSAIPLAPRVLVRAA